MLLPSILPQRTCGAKGYPVDCCIERERDSVCEINKKDVRYVFCAPVIFVDIVDVSFGDVVNKEGALSDVPRYDGRCGISLGLGHI